MSQRLRPDGYVAVSLYRNGKQKQYFLHRLLAQTYIPNPNNYPEVNHIDENKSNNDITNLEWCTHKYNSNYGTRLQRMATTNSVPVIQYDKSGNEIARYKSQKGGGRGYGSRQQTYRCVCKGKAEKLREATYGSTDNKIDKTGYFGINNSFIYMPKSD